MFTNLSLTPRPYHVEIPEFCKQCNIPVDERLFQVKTYDEFLGIYNETPDEEKEKLLLSLNKSGYTFPHVLFWRYSKERYEHRSPRYAEECRRILDYLSTLPELQVWSIFSRGTPEDPLCTCFHDFARNVNYFKADDTKLLDKFRAKGLDPLMSREDSSGMTVDDMLFMKSMSKEIKNKIYKLQVEMKKDEKYLEALYEKYYGERFHRCKKCLRPMARILDIDHVTPEESNRILTSEDVEKIKRVIFLRTEIMHLFSRFTRREGHFERDHQETIDVWKRKLYYYFKK